MSISSGNYTGKRHTARFYAPKTSLLSVCARWMSVSAGGAGLEDVDPDLHAARTELMLSDQERTPVELAVGVHAASAAAMQNQHMADDVNAAARRGYLGITDDVSARLTPFEQYVVVDVLTQVARCTPRPACSQPASRVHPARCCLQVEQGTSYFFKVQVADAEFIQLRVFLSLFGDAPQLVALRKGAEAAGPLQCFEAAE